MSVAPVLIVGRRSRRAWSPRGAGGRRRGLAWPGWPDRDEEARPATDSLAIDELTDDVEGAPRLRALVGVRPRVRQADQQGTKNGAGAVLGRRRPRDAFRALDTVRATIDRRWEIASWSARLRPGWPLDYWYDRRHPLARRVGSSDNPETVRRVRWPWGVLAVFTAGVVLGVVLRGIPSPAPPAPSPVEIGLHLLLIAGLLWASPPLRQYLERLPLVFAAPLGALLVLLFAGQFVALSRETFPFAHWDMYGRVDRRQTSEYLRLRGIEAAGGMVRIRASRLLPSVSHSGMLSRLSALQRWSMTAEAAPAGDAEVERGTHALEDVLSTYLSLWNRRYPSRPLSGIVLYRCRVRVLPRGTERTPQCEVVEALSRPPSADAR